MLYLWTQNYSQITGICPGHHGQLISQNCVLTKIRAEPPPPPLNASGFEDITDEHVKCFIGILVVSGYYNVPQYTNIGLCGRGRGMPELPCCQCNASCKILTGDAEATFAASATKGR